LYTYDGFGNLVLVTKPDADTIEYAYNGLNQMTQEKFDANNFNDFEYCCCSLTKHQQTVGGSQEDPYELTYDKMHRMTQEQYPDSGAPKTEYFDYEYDQAGRRVKMVDPTYGRDDSKPMRWKYEEDGKLIRVGRSEDTNYLRNQGEDYHVLYDGRGRIWKVLYPGENNQPVMEVEYQYTAGGQIAKIIARDLTQGTPTDIYCQEFEYDVNGRKTRQVQKEKESDLDTAAYYITTFAYDSRDMLVEEKYQRWDSGNSTWDNMYWARYQYDTAGNMVERVVDQIVNGNAKDYVDSSFTYSRGYQLTGFNRRADSGSETRTFTLTYDANGNMTHIFQSATFTDTFYNITEMEFQFDEKNRMTHYRFGGSGSYYQIKYDALGRVRERVDLNGPTGLMRQLDVDASNKKRFYIKDTLGTVLALVDPSNLSVEHYNYNAWGEHLDKDDTDFPTDENQMRYIGCRVEAFANSTAQTDAIYHFDRNHYLPVLGIFLKINPLARINRLVSRENPFAREYIKPPELPPICRAKTPDPEEPGPQVPHLPGTHDLEPVWPIDKCWCPCWIPYDPIGLINGEYCWLIFGPIIDSVLDAFPYMNRTVYWDSQFTCCNELGVGISNILHFIAEILDDLLNFAERYIDPTFKRKIELCFREGLCDLCTYLLQKCKDPKVCGPEQTNPDDVCDEYCELDS